MQSALVLTAIKEEYLAVRKHLADLTEVVSNEGDIYESGTFHGRHQKWRVMTGQIGPLQASASASCTRAISYCRPDIAIFCGVAGGLKDVKIGDVVAALLVYGYQSGKVGEKGFQVRPRLRRGEPQAGSAGDR